MPARTAWSRNTAVQHRARRRVEPEADVGQAEDDLDVGELGRGSRRSPPASTAPSLRSSSLPVAMVKVSGSISRSDCARPCWSQAKSTSRRGDRAACRSAVFAMPTSSMVSAITAAPNRFASLSRSVRVPLAVLEIDRVDDRLAAMQLQRGLDHRRFGAVDHQRRVHRGGEAADHLVHLAQSRRGRRRRCRCPARASPRRSARGPWRRSRPSRASPAARATSSSRWRCSARRWRRWRSPGAAAPPGTRLATAGTHTGVRATGAGRRLAAPRAASHPARRCASIEVPQQPPIRLTPSSATKRSSQLASSAAPSG